ncbi:MAG: ribosome biogenesis GTP-binding protein YihA/YsxC [Alcanivoracaceae bacterium]|jgi:GTP-binding protein|nr:ribosome biogenesis GTP-binding protein YihA/YsxC [Alcanivoracaceae bacterium]
MHPVEQILRQIRFDKSAQKLAQCPPDEGLEIAFAGRSNAGKSSAINRLCGQKSLARTSKTAGRTQLLNFFAVDEGRRIVDLPGYGYAKVDRSTRDAWQKEIDGYLSGRECLKGLILLMDVRHPLKDFDQMIIQWAAEANMPLHLLLTKADKLSYGVAKNALLKTAKQLSSHRAPLSLQLFSSTNGMGCDQAWDKIGEWLDLPVPAAAPQA